MLRIRKEQMKVFEQSAVSNFESRMLEYLRTHFPKLCDLFGEERTRKIILYSINRAKVYDLTSEYEVCLYLSLMFMLGSNFDEDIQLPWAAEILNDKTLPDGHDRIDRLYSKAMDYLDAVAGKDNKHIADALNRIRQEQIDSVLLLPGSGFIDRMIAWLNKIFPEKCDVLGEDLIRRLILHGTKFAKSYGLTTERGMIIYIGLMFMLGSSFDTDLQFPWATTVLNDKAITDPDQKASILYDEAMTMVDWWLA